MEGAGRMKPEKDPVLRSLLELRRILGRMDVNAPIEPRLPERMPDHLLHEQEDEL
jgi:hypothetical protein